MYILIFNFWYVLFKCVNDEGYQYVSVSVYKIKGAVLPGECDSVTVLEDHIINFQAP